MTEARVNESVDAPELVSAKQPPFPAVATQVFTVKSVVVIYTDVPVNEPSPPD